MHIAWRSAPKASASRIAPTLGITGVCGEVRSASCREAATRLKGLKRDVGVAHNNNRFAYTCGDATGDTERECKVPAYVSNSMYSSRRHQRVVEHRAQNDGDCALSGLPRLSDAE